MYVHMYVCTTEYAVIYFCDHLFGDEKVDWIQLACCREHFWNFVNVKGP
jgi:hypothetical protein